jgi:hypothetical protein
MKIFFHICNEEFPYILTADLRNALLTCKSVAEGPLPFWVYHTVHFSRIYLLKQGEKIVNFYAVCHCPILT